MAIRQTAKQMHDELVDGLRNGTHTPDMPGMDREVLAWDEYMGTEGPHEGKLIVAVQYGGPDGGGGGLRRDYIFDPEQIKADEAAELAQAVEPANEAPVPASKPGKEAK